jgi:hypothetical protein
VTLDYFKAEQRFAVSAVGKAAELTTAAMVAVAGFKIMNLDGVGIVVCWGHEGSLKCDSLPLL